METNFNEQELNRRNAVVQMRELGIEPYPAALYEVNAKAAEIPAKFNAQAEELARKQKEYDSGVALIKAECEDAGLLPDSYIRELEYKVATEIILEIKQDKKSRAEMLKQAEDGEKTVIGADVDSEIAKQMAKATEIPEDETRVRVMRVTYKASQAKAIASFFKSAGIKFEFINSDF